MIAVLRFGETRRTTMNRNPISRRSFARLLTIGAAAAGARPRLNFAAEPQGSPAASAAPTTGVIRLSANENPYGPSARALQAISETYGIAGRYPDEQNDALTEALAGLNEISHDQILLGDGSSEILKVCAAAFTGPGRRLAAADPTFEAILNYAKMGSAEVVKVPLTSTFAHDLPKMGSAARGGLLYICNPNNPTASITPKDELRTFIEKAPRETTILVDEAYFHFADGPDYES